MARRRSGIVLVVVLFFALLLASTVATFARIALIDHMIVKNRDARSRADALARGGIRLATALLLEDKLHEQTAPPPPAAGGPGAATGAAPTGKDAASPTGLDHHEELWARVSGQPIRFEDGSTLRIQIEDAGAKLNLNAAVAFDEEGAVDAKSVELLNLLFDKVTGEMFGPNQSNPYDPAELAVNLIDYIDKDQTRQSGGEEADTYLNRIPPAVPADGPLLSVDELRRVEGFDARLVDALRPYVTVYPYRAKKGGGINPNTAPPYVLKLLFFDDEVQQGLAGEDTIRSILQIRKDGGFVCGEGQSAEGCTPIRSIVTNAIFPEPSFSSDVFVVTALAQIGDVARRVEAVVDRSEGAEPRLLSWRVL